jgi:hypothetical protein
MEFGDYHFFIVKKFLSLMNKRNKLRLNTPDTTFDFTRTDETNGTINDTNRTIDDTLVLNPNINPQNTTFLKSTSNYIMDNIKPLCIIAILVLYILLKPNENTILLEEIHNLKKLSIKTPSENLCKINIACTVETKSPLFKWGFYKSCIPNTYSIMEENN